MRHLDHIPVHQSIPNTDPPARQGGNIFERGNKQHPADINQINVR